MADALLTHDGHAFVNGLSRLCNDDVSFHDVSYGRRRRRLAPENNVPRVVPFGDDADEFLAVHHDQRANVLFSHFRDGVEDAGIRVNRPNVPALLIKQLSHRGHLDPPSDASSGNPAQSNYLSVRQLLAKSAVSRIFHQTSKLRMTHEKQRLMIAGLHIDLRLRLDAVVHDEGQLVTVTDGRNSAVRAVRE